MTVSTDQTFKPMEVGPYRCEATCHIGNKSCVVDAKFVEVHSTQSPEGISSLYNISSLGGDYMFVYGV